MRVTIAARSTMATTAIIEPMACGAAGKRLLASVLVGKDSGKGSTKATQSCEGGLFTGAANGCDMISAVVDLARLIASASTGDDLDVGTFA